MQNLHWVENKNKGLTTVQHNYTNTNMPKRKFILTRIYTLSVRAHSITEYRPTLENPFTVGVLSHIPGKDAKLGWFVCA